MAVMRALELIGKRVARDGRARFGAMQRSGMDWSDVHTVWKPEPHHVEAALAGAWNVLPRMVNEHGCCSLQERKLTLLLDGYVRELVFSMQPHKFEELERRIRDAIQS
jgi:hypothetical protein